MKNKIIILPLIFLLGIFINCHDEITTPTVVQNYTFDVVEGQTIKTEFDYYLLAWNEARDIWIGGNLSGKAETDYKKVWYHSNWTTDKQDLKDRAKINTSTNKYFQRMELKGPGIDNHPNEGDCDFRIGLETSTGYGWDENKPIYFINPRKYNIEYSCQIGYNALDLAALSWAQGDENALVDAFSAANTEVPAPRIISIGLQPKVIDLIQDPSNIERDDLWTYAKEHVSSDYVDIPPNPYRCKTALLFAVEDFVRKDILGNEIPPEPDDIIARGLSRASYNPDALPDYSQDPTPLPMYSFVFVQKVIDLQLSQIETIKEYRRVIIHELGHQRGIPTSKSHIEGHKGTDRDYCVMRNCEHESNERNTLRFCEGHKQRLLNKHFVGE
jgi:hypothetical protein